MKTMILLYLSFNLLLAERYCQKDRKWKPQHIVLPISKYVSKTNLNAWLVQKLCQCENIG